MQEPQSMERQIWGQRVPQWIHKGIRKGIHIVVLCLCSWVLLTGCSLPQVSAEDRLFLNLSADFLGVTTLPKSQFEGTTVGGLSAIAYDQRRDRFYALSDDRRNARFYTLKLTLDKPTGQPKPVAIETVTPLLDDAGQPYPNNTIDPEGIALSPTGSLFISSEGVARDGIPPFIAEFDRTTGKLLRRLPLPPQYLPNPQVKSQANRQNVSPQNASPQDAQSQDAKTPQGVQDNLGFEGLTLNPLSATGGPNPTGEVEPFRLFAITESSLLQDTDPANPGQPALVRMLHYQLDSRHSLLVAEHEYPVEPAALGTRAGVSELLAIDQGGHFLVLERAFGTAGFSIQLYQMTPAGASDTSGYLSLTKTLPSTQPVRKQLLLDLTTLGITLDNLEGMALGPQLSDGSRSLVLISDDNFRAEQVTQLLVFRLRGLKS
jgi:hypothetical protein